MTSRLLRAAALATFCLTIVGCPTPSPPSSDAGTPVSEDAGRDSDPMADAPIVTIDTGDERDAALGMDSPTGMEAPELSADGGVVTTWTDCGEAVVFGSEGEACSFTGSCVECLLVVSPRQVLCAAGRLRVAAAGPGACGATTDAGVSIFPDVGRLDGGLDDGVCPSLTLPAPTEAVCSDATVACLHDGGDPAMCITADAPCLSCVQAELTACATTTGGCADEAGAAQCCFTENCPDGSCSATVCRAEWEAYMTCYRAAPCSVGDVCFPSAPACPPAEWPAPAVAGCTTATLDCLIDAPDSAAIQACIAADTSSTPTGESCAACINDDVFACATNNGCSDELGLVQCCLNAQCPAGDATCVDAALGTGGACESDWSGFFVCVTPMLSSGACGITRACFP